MPTAKAEGTSKEVYINDALPAIAAGENHIGQAGSPAQVIDVTPTLDTLIYAAGDVLFDTTEITGVARLIGGRVKLVSVVLIDEDDQGVALDLYFLRSNVSLGTFNAAPAITDANARELQGHVAVATGDWKDLGGARVACIENINLLMEPLAASLNLFVAAVTGGTPTHTASGLKLRFGVEQY